MFKDWRIKHQLLALLLSILVAFVLLSGHLLSKQAAAAQSTENLYEQDYQIVSLIGRIDGLLTRVDINILRMIAIGDPASIATWKAENSERFNTVDRQIGELRSTADPSLAASIATLSDAYGRMRKGMERQVQAVQAGDIKGGAEINRNEVKDNADKTFATLAELKRLQDAQTKSKVDAVLSEKALTRTVSMVGVGFVALAALLCGLLTIRNLLRQLGGEPRYAVEVVGRIAQGDLSVEVQTERGDHASLLAAMNAMRGSLAAVVRQVHSSSERIASATSEIATGNADLSQRTEEQASALQQTAATMEQLSTTVRNNTDHAMQANRMAQSASEIAAKGGDVVGEVVSTMQSISDSSRKIGDIIGVIDGIAFQTNILALNAAVEAARAGEQGRGFAVVASEVRGLAQRSAEAAKEIKSLIGRSVAQVEQGTVLVDQAGKTMDEIVGSIKRVSEIVAEISSAGQEQSSGISQVGDAVGQIDQMTQQNAALVEESAASAESLKNQAQQLVQAVAVFKLSGQAAVQTA